MPPITFWVDIKVCASIENLQCFGNLKKAGIQMAKLLVMTSSTKTMKQGLNYASHNVFYAVNNVNKLAYSWCYSVYLYIFQCLILKTICLLLYDKQFSYSV